MNIELFWWSPDAFEQSLLWEFKFGMDRLEDAKLYQCSLNFNYFAGCSVFVLCPKLVIAGGKCG